MGAVAAGFVLVVGLGGLALTQFGGGGGNGRLPQGDVQAALDVAMRKHATKVNLGEASEVSAPGLEAFYLLGTHVPQPSPGRVYRLWTVSGDRATYVGYFLPDANGLVVIRIELDPSSFDRVLVTEEPIDSTPSIPGDPAWQTAA